MPKADVIRCIEAHNMSRRRCSVRTISRALGARPDQVRRWLASPCPTLPKVALAEEEDWKLHALCRAHPNPDLWHPDWERDSKRGKSICHTCPVQLTCLQWAVDHEEEFGTWGGLSEWDRYRLGLARPIHRRRPLSTKRPDGMALRTLTLLPSV